MAVALTRSFVPRIAVEKTIRRGIELYEGVNGPADEATRKRIRNFVVQQANILNAQAQIKDDEMQDSILYPGRNQK